MVSHTFKKYILIHLCMSKNLASTLNKIGELLSTGSPSVIFPRNTLNNLITVQIHYS